jgi:hypothetical protein
MIIVMSVSLFSHRPQRCPFGHPLWPGQARVGWKPCICTPAREQAERGRGMGHLWVSCQACHAQLWDATFYEPPHDISCHQAGPWLCLPAWAYLPGLTCRAPGPAGRYRPSARRSGGRVVTSTVPL